MLILNFQHYFRIRKRTYYLPLVLVCNFPAVFADSLHSKLSISSNKSQAYVLPNSITATSLTELHQLKRKYESQITSHQAKDRAMSTDEASLLNSLFTYEYFCLQISDIILKFIDEYKAYGTHFSVVYVSLLYTFKENSAFYSQYREDITNPESIIGKYQTELSISYKEAEKIHNTYESSKHNERLNNIIAQLNNEIRMRENKLTAQRNIDLHL